MGLLYTFGGLLWHGSIYFEVYYDIYVWRIIMRVYIMRVDIINTCMLNASQNRWWNIRMIYICYYVVVLLCYYVIVC
jgi:hypothetical protein